MKLIPSDPSYATDTAANNIWRSLQAALGTIDGICYYKHPVIISATRSIPHFTLLARNYEPLAIQCFQHDLGEIEEINEQTWKIKGQLRESPFLDLEDYIFGFQNKFDRERLLRRKFKSVSAIALPLINKTDFEKKFGKISTSIKIIWSNYDVKDILVKLDSSLDDVEWRLAKSIFQGVGPLNNGVGYTEDRANKMGEALKILSKEIALLDEAQHEVATQIAPGPQQIRGLAGTGKTVVLAKKAANIHLRFPDKKILFTFHTQSLYNQTKTLISKFYRVYSDTAPEWDILQVRHGWGGKERPGVYSDICKYNNTPPLTLTAAKEYDLKFPFRACCKAALRLKIEPIYDYILVDEAQDFPDEFFQVLIKLTGPEKHIYWAFDELQNLSARKVPDNTQRFGVDKKGKPVISIGGEDYPGGIEKDFVLNSSYRCTKEGLMLAHGLGLGIHSPRGCVQMLDNKGSWEAIGYVLEKGSLQKDEDTTIFRPKENSPNRIGEIYTGNKPFIQAENFETREEELKWVAESIRKDIQEEGVRPEDIVVISLNAKPARDYLMNIQSKLIQSGIYSTIPGLIDRSCEFAEPNMVTLATVYRAKGNEASVVYIISFDSLYDYVEELENRNRAFTAISRAKAWIRICGTGKNMAVAKREIDKIVSDIPHFHFIFPDMEKIKRLGELETTRRRKEFRKAKNSIERLLDINKDTLSSLNADHIEKLKDLLDEIKNED